MQITSSTIQTCNAVLFSNTEFLLYKMGKRNPEILLCIYGDFFFNIKQFVNN